MSVIWHDLECGAYAEDLPFWRSLADEHGDPVLDIGAGTGRIALDLARHGHQVTALDRDEKLLDELRERSDGLGVQTVLADARDFDLGAQFALCIVPMQTIQLLGGEQGRAAFLRCAQRHLRSGGVVAIALSDVLECSTRTSGSPVPLPDVCERHGVVYSSLPTAVRAEPDGFVLERRRETVTAHGQRTVERNIIMLDRADRRRPRARGERDRAAAGRRRHTIPATTDYVGSTVVMLGV